MYILRSETDVECPGAEIPQFTNLVSASHHTVVLSQHGCIFEELTQIIVFMRVALHSTTIGGANKQSVSQIL